MKMSKNYSYYTIMECIICYEPVYKSDLYIPECGCKYEAHIQCIQEWNGACIVCNATPKPKFRSEMIFFVICIFILIIILSRTIL